MLQFPKRSILFFRVFYAIDRKASEYFRISSNKSLNRLREKSYSGLIVVVQSFTTNGSENPCIASSIPVLANFFYRTQEVFMAFFVDVKMRKNAHPEENLTTPKTGSSNLFRYI
jgi:hypothetical protein